LTVQCIVPKAIFGQPFFEGLEITLLRKLDTIPSEFIVEKVENPDMEMRLKGLIKLTNQKVF